MLNINGPNRTNSFSYKPNVTQQPYNTSKKNYHSINENISLPKNIFRNNYVEPFNKSYFKPYRYKLKNQGSFNNNLNRSYSTSPTYASSSTKNQGEINYDKNTNDVEDEQIIENLKEKLRDIQNKYLDKVSFSVYYSKPEYIDTTIDSEFKNKQLSINTDLYNYIKIVTNHFSELSKVFVQKPAGYIEIVDGIERPAMRSKETHEIKFNETLSLLEKEMSIIYVILYLYSNNHSAFKNNIKIFTNIMNIYLQNFPDRKAKYEVKDLELKLKDMDNKILNILTPAQIEIFNDLYNNSYLNIKDKDHHDIFYRELQTAHLYDTEYHYYIADKNEEYNFGNKEWIDMMNGFVEEYVKNMEIEKDDPKIKKLKEIIKIEGKKIKDRHYKKYTEIILGEKNQKECEEIIARIIGRILIATIFDDTVAEKILTPNTPYEEKDYILKVFLKEISRKGRHKNVIGLYDNAYENIFRRYRYNMISQKDNPYYENFRNMLIGVVLTNTSEKDKKIVEELKENLSKMQYDYINEVKHYYKKTKVEYLADIIRTEINNSESSIIIQNKNNIENLIDKFSRISQKMTEKIEYSESNIYKNRIDFDEMKFDENLALMEKHLSILYLTIYLNKNQHSAFKNIDKIISTYSFQYASNFSDREEIYDSNELNERLYELEKWISKYQTQNDQREIIEYLNAYSYLTIKNEKEFEIFRKQILTANTEEYRFFTYDPLCFRSNDPLKNQILKNIENMKKDKKYDKIELLTKIMRNEENKIESGHYKEYQIEAENQKKSDEEIIAEIIGRVILAASFDEYVANKILVQESLDENRDYILEVFIKELLKKEKYTYVFGLNDNDYENIFRKYRKDEDAQNTIKKLTSYFENENYEKSNYNDLTTRENRNTTNYERNNAYINNQNDFDFEDLGENDIDDNLNEVTIDDQRISEVDDPDEFILDDEDDF